MSLRLTCFHSTKRNQQASTVFNPKRLAGITLRGVLEFEIDAVLRLAFTCAILLIYIIVLFTDSATMFDQ